MSLCDQSDKDLADAGRMLANEISKIAAELERRGLAVEFAKYYYPSPHYEFETEEVI
jgi:hypothetical protein